jgi:hypothetical protein
MGVVLEAHDPELDRKVAIKLLRPELGTGPEGLERSARLQREAQAMARLSHPNVVAVYEVGRIEDQVFIAMELVLGSTLRAWMRAPRPWRAVVAMFVAAGRGLAAAHAAGMVHRDFKPDNVLVGHDGRARVTDFGLVTGERRQVDTPASSLMSMSLTGEGETLGTPTYMSPEHWDGERIDARSDQFSFCVSLWEAVYGRRPFVGEGVAGVRAAVREGRVAPPPDGASVPRWLERALRRGLARAPADRWPSMTALLDALEARLALRRRAPWLALGGVAVVAAIVVTAVLRRAPPVRDVAAPPASPAPPPRSAAFVISAPGMQRLTFADGCEANVSLSPDGATAYYDGVVGGAQRLFAIDLATATPVELTHGDHWDLAPTPSPDGARLAFLRTSEGGSMSLYVADRAHLDQPRLVAPGGMRPVWSPDGRHVWSGTQQAIVRHDLATGAIGPTLTPPPGKFPLVGLELADGRFVLLMYPLDGSATADKVVVYPAAGGAPKELYAENMLEVLAPLGDDAVVVAMSHNNRAVELWRVPLDGAKAERLSSEIDARSHLAIAGRRLVWSNCEQDTSLAAVASGKFVDLARSDWADWSPAAIPGTTDLAFISDRAGVFGVYRMDRAHAGTVTRIELGALEPTQLAVSPDARTLALAEGAALYVAPLDGAAPPVKLIDEQGPLEPSFDRTSRHIYFERHAGDGYRIASIAVTGGAPTWAVAGYAAAPAMSPTADVLAYIAMPAAGQRVPTLLDLRTGKARALLPARDARPWSYLRWSPDGTRILLVRRDGESIELAIATGQVLRRFSVGADLLVGVTYLGDDIIVSHSAWHGDVWTAALESAPR